MEPLGRAKCRAEGCVNKKGVAIRLQLTGSPAEMERDGCRREAWALKKPVVSGTWKPRVLRAFILMPASLTALGNQGTRKNPQWAELGTGAG